MTFDQLAAAVTMIGGDLRVRLWHGVYEAQIRSLSDGNIIAEGEGVTIDLAISRVVERLDLLSMSAVGPVAQA